MAFDVLSSLSLIIFCIFLKDVFIYFWLHWVFVAACRLSLVAASGGFFFDSVCGPLTAVASLAAEHGLQSSGQLSRRTGLAAPRQVGSSRVRD